MRLKGKNIILGVSGSIAAYKAVSLLRLLQQEGAEIRVTMTAAAEKFVAPLTFETLSRRPVFKELWSAEETWSAHVRLAREADGFVVAPATAHTLFKLANGACDDALTALYLSAVCPLVVAPAMDLEMYAHASVQNNLNLLRARGGLVVEPETGYLASGLEGKGRLAAPETICEAVVSSLASEAFDKTFLRGKKILITAGPTREALDPVRYLTNHSTGKMGVALARAAFRYGAQVTMVAGPCSVPLPSDTAEIISVTTADEMFAAVKTRAAEQDAFILCAAVADYRPKNVSQQKIKKGDATYLLELEKTPDILAYLGENRREEQTLVGFALETEDVLAHATDKLKRKKADFIVANSSSEAGAGFGGDTNRVTILAADGRTFALPLLSKDETAQKIIETIFD